MKIGIVGLGLIGGSIFKSLKLSGKHEVIGVSSTVVTDGASSDYKTLSNCELVFVCTPMNATLEILAKLENFLSPDAIVTDVCSLKGFVSQKNYSYKFIPSHPMAGTENNGWESSFVGLFKGAKWAITPINNEVLPEQELLEGVIKELGAEVIITTAEEHDKAVALISHMPLVLSQALCENIKDNKLAQTLASSGFRDMTRLALSNTQMANDMVMLNSENIKSAIALTNKSIDNLLNLDYYNKANEIKDFRKDLY